MAIQQDAEFKGLTIPEAYIKIEALRFDAPSNVYVKMALYASEEATESLEDCYKEFNYPIEKVGGKDNLSFEKVYIEVMKEEFFKDGKMV